MLLMSLHSKTPTHASNGSALAVRVHGINFREATRNNLSSTCYIEVVKVQLQLFVQLPAL